MSALRRIQLQRTKGWRMPSNTVKVTRPGRWGNPFRIGEVDRRTGGTMDAATAVERFTEALVHGRLRSSEADARQILRGKNLACWCRPGDPCHADILLDIANG